MVANAGIVDRTVPVRARRRASPYLSRASRPARSCRFYPAFEVADLRTVDVHFYVMLASATLKDAYGRLSRYQRLIHETSRVELVPEHDGATLRHVLPGGLAAPRQTAEFLVAAWARTGRIATDTDWSPAEARFAHSAPADVREHARFFHAPVRFHWRERARHS